jgi:hypothetical protein
MVSGINASGIWFLAAATAFGLLAPVSSLAGPSKTLHILYSFPATGDGYPVAGLTADAAGNLYGTTGGQPGQSRTGSVFELSPKTGGGWTETTLYNFCSKKDCTDGNFPRGGVIVDGTGNLFGTTADGGAYNNGTVY